MSCTLLFTEDFSGFPGTYTVLAGSSGVWTAGSSTYGGTATHSHPTVNTSIVQRSISSGSVNRYDLKFQVTSTGTNGSGFIQMFDGGFNGPIVVPRDNQANDALQRTGINPGTGIVYFALPAGIGDWMQLSLVYSTTSGASTATLTDLTAGGTPQTITFPGILVPRTISNIRLNNPNNTAVAGVAFADVELYNCATSLFPSFTATPTTCYPGTTVTFTDTSTPSGATSWAWDFGDSNSSTLENPTHSYTSPGNYSVVLTPTWPAGTASSSPTVIDVQAPTVQFTASPTSGIVGQTITFTDTSVPSGIISWSWNFGDSGSSTLENPTHSYSAPGVYNVVLTATYSFGTYSSSPVAITITQPHLTAFSNGGVTTGKRYFEILIETITAYSNFGLSIGRDSSDLLTPLAIGAQSSDRWILFGPNSNSVATYYTGATSYTTGFNTSGFTFTNGTVIGFAVNMDTGTLDGVYINGVQQSISPTSGTAYASIAPWTPASIVRPLFDGIPNASPPLGQCTLRVAGETIQYLPVGYSPWNDSVPVPFSITLTENTVDMFVDQLTDNEWAQLSVKGTVATFPTKFYNDGDYPLNGVYVWPIPNVQQAVTAWLWEPLSTLDTIDNELNLPKGYERAVRFNLAVELAAEYGKEIPARVSKTAAVSKSMVKRLNSEPQIMAGDEAIAQQKPFNWQVGDTLAN